MKKKKRLKIELSNRWLYTLLILGILTIISVGIYAYGTSSPSTFGHSIEELEDVQARVTETCSSGSSIRVINSDGSVSCESDNYEANTDYCKGGSCRGNLNVYGYLSTSQSPTSNNHVATKSYVDAQIAALGGGPETWECVVESRTRSISSRRYDISVSCSSGYNLIIGGCSISGEPRANDYTNSYPLENGWYCSVLDNYQKESITAYARCCK